MAFDKLKGQAEQAAGHVQSGVGGLAGDRSLQAEGEARKIGGQAQDLYGEAKARVEDVTDYATEVAGDVYERGGDYAQRGAKAVHAGVKDFPVTALLLSAAIAFIMGMLVQRAMEPTPRARGRIWR